MKNAKGITLIEIVIVLLIIGVLALFIFPNIPKMRGIAEVNTCIGNLWLIKVAKEQWALDEEQTPGTTVEWSNIIPGYMDQRPVCPATKTSNSYTLNVVGQNPTCTETGHVIE